MNLINYYIKFTCPSCSQGRLVISRDDTNERLYLHCEGCEMGWSHPSEVENRAAGFLTLVEEFDSHSASVEEITEANWTAFVAGNFEL